MDAKRIGVDATCWLNKRGFGRMVRELLRAMVSEAPHHTYVFFADDATVAQSDFPEGVTAVSVPTSVSPQEAASGAGRRSIRDVWLMTRYVARENIDLFFFPAVYSYFPIMNRVPVYVTIHDMIADNNPKLVFQNWRLKLFWKLKQNLAIFQSKKILTISKYSKNAICDFYHLPYDRVCLMTEGPQDCFRRIERTAEGDRILCNFGLSSNSRYLLHVGGFSPHKNLHLLVSVAARLRKEPGFSDLELVLVGDYKTDSFFSGFGELRELIDDLRISDVVHLTGYVGDEDLVHIYNRADAFVFPSFEEGFGLPAVEAMACGTPLISSNRGSLPEICGEAAVYFDPSNQEDLLRILREVLSSSERLRTMSEAGLDRAREFTWRKGARLTLAHFEDV